MSARQRRTLVLVAAGLALTGCSGGGEHGSDTTTATTVIAETVAVPDRPDAGSTGTTEAPATPASTTTTTTTEPYDEAARTPLDQLAERFAESVGDQEGDEAVAGCMIDAVVAAWDDGRLSPVDLDEYSRAGRITAVMQAFLEDLQGSGACGEG